MSIELIPEGAKTVFDDYSREGPDSVIHFYVFEDSNKNRFVSFGAGWVNEEDKVHKSQVLKNMKSWFDLNPTEDVVEGTMNTFVPTHRAKHRSLTLFIQTGDEYYYFKKVS